MRSRLRAPTLSQEAPVGSMGQQGAAIWLGRQSPPDRTLASVRFLWQAQSPHQATSAELGKTAFFTASLNGGPFGILLFTYTGIGNALTGHATLQIVGVQGTGGLTGVHFHGTIE